MLTYDPNTHAALGVGDRVTADCFKAVHPFNPESTTGNNLIPVKNHEIGTIIFDSTPDTFVRRLDAVSPAGHAVFDTGAMRSNATGRGRFDLIPYEAMLSLARRYEMGADSFGERNWERGQPLSRLLSSMRRHAHQIGYDYTEDHAGAVLWNAAAFVAMVERMRAGILPKTLDDVGYFINEEATK